MREGDFLTLADGSTATVTRTHGEQLDEPVIVYNFEVKDFHTYYVSNKEVFVHNSQLCTKPINRVSYKKVEIDMEEVLSGHTSNGNRAKQSGIKDLFPDSMSPNNIKKEIIEAYKNAQQVGSPQFDGLATRIRLQGQGTEYVVEMWYNKSTKTIETAYPIYGTKVKI